MKSLQELNPNTEVTAISGELTNEILANHQVSESCPEPTTLTECRAQVVVCIGTPLDESIRINEFCRTQDPPIQFLRGDVYGLCGSAFADFGDVFHVSDPDWEPCSTAIVESIEKSSPAVVKCIFEDDGRHDLQDGDLVEFTEVRGMTELNSGQYKVTVKNPYSFTIEDTTGFSDYASGGLVHQVKQAANPKFRSLRESLVTPAPLEPKPGQDPFLECDLSKCFGGRSMLLHLVMRALDAFQVSHGGSLPAPPTPEATEHPDTAEVIATVKSFNAEYSEDARIEVEEDFIAKCAHGSRAIINPMCAIFGGFIGQEVGVSVSFINSCHAHAGDQSSHGQVSPPAPMVSFRFI